jgi:hypothetical protein
MNMNQAQKPQSLAKPHVNNFRPIMPMTMQRPGHQLMQQRLSPQMLSPSRMFSPSQGIRTLSPQRNQPVILGNNSMLPAQSSISVVPMAPQIVTIST